MSAAFYLYNIYTLMLAQIYKAEAKSIISPTYFSFEPFWFCSLRN